MATNPSILRIVVCAVLCATVLFFSLVAFPLASQVPGASPRESLNPKTYEQISSVLEIRQALSDLKIELAVQNQSIIDIVHRLDIQRADISAMQPEVEVQRITKLEQYIAEQQEERAKREADDKAGHDAIMGWVRGIGAGILVSMAGIGANLYLAHRRENHRDSQMDVLTRQTNGMTGRIAALSEAKGHADEKEIQAHEKDV